MAKVEIDVPDFEGKEIDSVSVDREPNALTWGRVQMSVTVTYRKKETYRPATVEDAIRALRGEEVRCRVRDFECDPWRESVLLGLYSSDAASNFPWSARNLSSPNVTALWRFCEVLES